MPAPFVRRPTTHPNGISSGGGDTGFHRQPQPTLFSVTLFDSNFRDVVLPKGTIILDVCVIPVAGSATPTGGSVKVDVWNANTNSATSSLLPASPVTAYLKVPIASPVPLAAETRIRFSASSILPAAQQPTGGAAVAVGLTLIVPQIRA